MYDVYVRKMGLLRLKVKLLPWVVQLNFMHYTVCDLTLQLHAQTGYLEIGLFNNRILSTKTLSAIIGFAFNRTG